MTAGPLRLRYANGEIRDVRFGGIEVVRRVYPVFQDRNWTARPWIIESERIQAGPDEFAIDVTGRGTHDAIAFSWQCSIRGGSDGTVALEFTGSAERPFLRNRLGLCVLHPVRNLAGAPVTVEHADGSLEETAFPLGIAPHQPFTSIRALTHHIAPGVQATIRMEGEIFETEDHRNWSDASYKHYCTPIALPFPVEVRRGDEVTQRVTISIRGAAVPTEAPPLRIDISDDLVALPALGVQLDHDGHRLNAGEVRRLRQLALAHVRIDLHPGDEARTLSAAIEDAREVGAALVVALIGVDPQVVADFKDVPVIDRWLVFDPESKVTDPQLVDRARATLGERVSGGTNLYFTELNRGRPESRGYIAFSANPQVHAWDDQSVMQNAWTLGLIARAARSIYPEAFLELSPLTLRPRWNPNATAPTLDVSNTPLPSRVDSRQCQPFGAAWTVLALTAITSAEALDAVTMYEATGWEGLMERASGSPQPADFPSAPGAVFPVYEVLALLAGVTHAHPTTSSDPDVAQALALGDGRVIVANATAVTQRPLVDDIEVEVAPYGVTVIDRRRNEG